MAYQDPKKVAPRTLFIAERMKAEKLYKRWLNVIMKKLKRVIAGVSNYGQMPAALSKFMASKEFRTLCEHAARQTVTMLAVGQQRSWRAAAMASSKGRRIFLALQKENKTKQIGGKIANIINANSQLIQTVPQSLANQFSRMAAEAQYAGKRPEELLEIFKQKAPHLTDVEARRIARTETGKAATALVQARADVLGLSFYRWDTVNDQRVRDSHRDMDGVICAWDDPPNPELLAKEPRTYGNYHPHGIFNCRCEALPIVNLKDIQFPCRVHYHGSIKQIRNQQEFNSLFGREVARYGA